jgi:hypothetical protein
MNVCSTTFVIRLCQTQNIASEFPQIQLSSMYEGRELGKNEIKYEMLSEFVFINTFNNE